MDAVSDIKARLPIDQLVGQYCQLQKKGRNFVSLCPFHSDTHPSFLVSPDKGIAYCFACQTGGDIFSFYQAIEKVDFRQALKDLAEKTGVKIEEFAEPTIKKDEKQRLRRCVEVAFEFYRKNLTAQKAKDYIKARGTPEELVQTFQLGYAPDSFSDTYQHLLKEGFSKNEILQSGMAIQKDIEGKMYDRFRNRLMFPIFDERSDIVGFGGRTLGEDDAKYINSSESPIYNKSAVLFGLHLAKEEMREKKKVVIVEGYFDVIACHRVGVKNVVAASGTALTDQHVKLLKRYVDTVVLCLDQDRAGKDAAERAFFACVKEGLQVNAVEITEKDPDEAANAHADALKQILNDGGMPYINVILKQIAMLPISTAEGKRDALQRLIPLLNALPSAVEREHYLEKAAAVMRTTATSLSEDMRNLSAQPVSRAIPGALGSATIKKDQFSSAEIALALFWLYPKQKNLLTELIQPEEEFAAALFEALSTSERKESLAEMLPPEFKERAVVLELYCEHHGFLEWSEGLAVREIHKNCMQANRDLLKRKQQEIAKKLIDARSQGRLAEEAQLELQYQSVLKLAKLASK